MISINWIFSFSSKFYKAIWFRGAERGINLDVGDKVDLAYMLKKNEYRGRVYVDLVVRDLKKVS